MIADLQRGIDPKDAEKIAQREAARARRNTFAAVAEDFMKERAKHLRSKDEYQRKLNVDILPEWGDLPIKEIERADVKALIQKKAATSPIAANRLLALIRTICNYAIDEELISASPAMRIKPEPESARERVLSATEIRNFWTGLDAAPVETPVRQLLRFLLVTGQRRGEATGARWDEIDFEANEWTIPSSRAKSGKAHVVPLSDLALDLLKDMSNGSDFVFPGARENAPLSPYSVSQGMRKSSAGPSACCRIQAYAIAVSMPSAGRKTGSPGTARRESSCSIGWWVGPSSPRKMESCVKTKISRRPMSADSRMAGRM